MNQLTSSSFYANVTLRTLWIHFAFFVDTQKQKLGISFSLIDVVTRQTDIQMQTN